MIRQGCSGLAQPHSLPVQGGAVHAEQQALVRELGPWARSQRAPLVHIVGVPAWQRQLG